MSSSSPPYKEDPAWDLFRSQKRASQEDPPVGPRAMKALQYLKLSLFLVSHVVLTAGAALSKLAVLLIATNLHAASGHKQCQRSVTRSAQVEKSLYVAVFLVQCIPDVCAMLQSAWRLAKEGKGHGSVQKMFVLLEWARCAGMCILLTVVCPKLDMFRCVCLLSATAIFPTMQSLSVRLRAANLPTKTLFQRMHLLMTSIPRTLICLAIISAAYLWSCVDSKFDQPGALAAGVLLCAVGYWESWVSLKHSGTFFHHLYMLKYGVRKLNAESRLLASLGRVCVGVGVVGWAAPHNALIDTVMYVAGQHKSIASNVIYLALGIVALNALLRATSRFLAAMDLEMIRVLHPACISGPLCIAMHFAVVELIGPCVVANGLARFGLSWRNDWLLTKPVTDVYLCCIWLLVGCYQSFHLASAPSFDKCDEVIASMSPVVEGLAIEQSLLVFRHSLAKKDPWAEEIDSTNGFSSDPLILRSDEVDRVSTLYICATMWHETLTEMTQMFGSILKLDEEHAHSATKNKRSGETRFRLEGHIFFDDAWEDTLEGTRVPNEFFKEFFALISQYCKPSEIDCTQMLANTAYGGRLVVRLPGGTLLFVHLKDKKLIRHKKRWSQVMYMYYLLGHRIMDSPLSVEDKQQLADNTFILAIDGDSKFEPAAVMRLLSLMRTKSDIGCACGRIHPIGFGFMVWYQKFEYAIAHWFQKAAEHVFGCVLCAPGCFSLFRASALMDDNIMQKYTTPAKHPRHFVQYDQGEDRWLSTLMLKQGYRIEYVAASDAETYAPEGFDEFFNQRRRWTPSSVANTIDLLADYKRAAANNASISYLYIVYQTIVIGFSLLGPAIIFSMLVFAQVAAFGVDSASVMIYNAIPVITYILACFYTESNIQLFLAKILSAVYAFIMLAVLVATACQIVIETVFSPTAMFIMFMVTIFSSSAVLHPKEFLNIVHGCVFFLMIPATYVFLSLYSLINLNVINWGTREAVAKATGQTETASWMERWLSRLAAGPLSFLAPSARPRADPHVEELERRLDRMHDKMMEMKKGDDVSHEDSFERLKRLANLDDSNVSTDVGEIRRLADPTAETHKVVRKSDPYKWMQQDYLQTCARGELKSSEDNFWQQLIAKYLKPITTTAAENRAAAEGLASLRDNIAFSIVLLNALLVLAIWLLQRHKATLGIAYDMGNRTWLKANEMGILKETREDQLIDPLGGAILVCLAGILGIQTVGMLIHRLNTVVGAFHEMQHMHEWRVDAAPRPGDDERLLEAAREMVDSSMYEGCHAADGYTRAATADRTDDNVVYKLQKARVKSMMKE